MFLNDDTIDDNKDSKGEVRRPSRPPSSGSSRMSIPGAPVGDDDDSGLGSAGALSSSAARSRVLQQQKELQMKKMQTRMGSGLLTSTTEKTESSITSSSRQLSKPKDVENDDEVSSPSSRRRSSVEREERSSRRKSLRDSDENGSDDDNRRPSSRRSRRDRRRDDDDDEHDDRRGSRRDRGREKDVSDEERPRTANRRRESERDRDGERDRDREKDRGRDRDRDRDARDDKERSDRPRDRRESRRSRKDDRSEDEDRDRGSSEDDRPRERERTRERRSSSARRRRNTESSEEEEEYQVSSRKSERKKSIDDNTSNADQDETRAVSPLKSPEKEGAEKAAIPPTVKVQLDLSDIRQFMMRPTPKEYGCVQCTIIRQRGSGLDKPYPEYFLHLREGDKFLACSKKRPKNKTSNYLISLQKGDYNRTGLNCLGKLRSNFIGTEFGIFDKGVNPKDLEDENQTVSELAIRQELGVVTYEQNLLGKRGPRKMRVAVPKVRDDNTRIIFRPRTKEEEIMTKLKDQDHTNLVFLVNKPPKWNDQVGAYVLNFNGRVTMASVKNFQLVTPDNLDRIVLQFGRVGQDQFTMDYQWPLSPFQAFAIALSSFDSKIACD